MTTVTVEEGVAVMEPRGLLNDPMGGGREYPSLEEVQELDFCYFGVVTATTDREWEALKKRIPNNAYGTATSLEARTEVEEDLRTRLDGSLRLANRASYYDKDTHQEVSAHDPNFDPKFSDPLKQRTYKRWASDFFQSRTLKDREACLLTYLKGLTNQEGTQKPFFRVKSKDHDDREKILAGDQRIKAGRRFELLKKEEADRPDLFLEIFEDTITPPEHRHPLNNPDSVKHFFATDELAAEYKARLQRKRNAQKRA